MASLSVILLTHNAGECLADCLESVEEVASDIVVGDLGSTDDTTTIVAGYQAKLVDLGGEQDRTRALNLVLAQAVGDWVLRLEPEEVLDPESVERVRHLLEADSTDVAAYEVTVARYCDEARAWRWVPAGRDNPYARGRGGYLRTSSVRLFQNGRGFEYRNNHEDVTQSVQELGGPIHREGGVTIHQYGYAPACEPQDAATLEVARARQQEAPEDVEALHTLARQALAAGETEEAERACREALKADPGHLDCLLLLGNVLVDRGDVEAAEKLFLEYEKAGLESPHIGIALAAVTLRKGQVQTAQARLERVLLQDPQALMARLYLARALDRQGLREHALRQLEMARDSAPSVPEFLDRVSAHLLRAEAEQFNEEGLYDQALEALLEALRLDAEDPLIHNDLGVVLTALGEAAKALEAFERARHLAPELKEPRENMGKILKG